MGHTMQKESVTEKTVNIQAYLIPNSNFLAARFLLIWQDFWNSNEIVLVFFPNSTNNSNVLAFDGRSRVEQLNDVHEQIAEANNIDGRADERARDDVLDEERATVRYARPVN